MSDITDRNPDKPEIIIVGGGAGGLELATRLGKKLGRKNKANITLVDESSVHVWKPLLHEIAAGSLDSNIDQLNYFSHASNHHYMFQLGKMVGLDRPGKTIFLAPLLGVNHEEIIPARKLHYDILVFAVGSQSFDYGISGAGEFCLALDNLAEADAFQKYFLNQMLSINYSPGSQLKPFSIVIVGGGATGVELAAELHKSLAEFRQYGIDHSTIQLARISIIESEKAILPFLPEKVAASVRNKLDTLGITLHTGRKVVEVTNEGFKMEDGYFISADIRIWAAGIKAPDFLKQTTLETDGINRLFVNSVLQTTCDGDIYAIGDCANFTDPATDRPIPARAQTAHQQAMYLAKRLISLCRHKKMGDAEFRYSDRGSIIALACYGAYGSLIPFHHFQQYIGGKIASHAYRSLYFYHLVSIYGFWSSIRLIIARRLIVKTRPRVKLHISQGLN